MDGPYRCSIGGMEGTDGIKSAKNKIGNIDDDQLLVLAVLGHIYHYWIL